MPAFRLHRLIEFCQRWFAAIVLLPLLPLAGYQFFKARIAWSYASNSVPSAVRADALAILLLALLTALLLVWQSWRVEHFLPWFAAGVMLLACLGIFLQRDRQMAWEGLDVPTENYNAALLALDNGALDLWQTWNGRGNPRVQPNYLKQPEIVLQRIHNLGLDWIAGDRWDRADLPQNNNRAYLHPPGYPLALGIWLGVFGRTRLAATLFEWAIKACLLLLSLQWAHRALADEQESHARRAKRPEAGRRSERNQQPEHIRKPPHATPYTVLSLTLATAPAFLMFVEPHSNELAFLLAVAAFALGYSHHEPRSVTAFFFSGVCIGISFLISFYSAFLALALLLVFGVAFLRSPRRAKLARLLALGFGAALPIVIGALLGYFPWLTYFTGSYHQAVYRLAHPHGILASVMDFAYFGFPLYLLLGIGILEAWRRRSTPWFPWMAAALLAFIAGAFEAWGLRAANRYLMGHFFLFIPLLSLAAARLRLSHRQALLIPLANFSFLALVTFF